MYTVQINLYRRTSILRPIDTSNDRSYKGRDFKTDVYTIRNIQLGRISTDLTMEVTTQWDGRMRRFFTLAFLCHSLHKFIQENIMGRNILNSLPAKICSCQNFTQTSVS